jgi:hypothetical protein
MVDKKSVDERSVDELSPHRGLYYKTIVIYEPS